MTSIRIGAGTVLLATTTALSACNTPATGGDECRSDAASGASTPGTSRRSQPMA